MAAAMRSLLCRTLRPEDNAVVAVDYKGTGNALLRIGQYLSSGSIAVRLCG